MEEVLVPRLNGPESGIFPVNHDFQNRAIMTLLGMHSELVKGVATHGGVATAMVSAGGGQKTNGQNTKNKKQTNGNPISTLPYANRDVCGYVETYMGTDIAILAGPGKGDQSWDGRYIAPLVKAHEEGTLLRLFRKHNGCMYRYCGLYKIVDRWRGHVQWSDDKKSYIEETKTCFVKLKRVPGQAPLIPVELEPSEDLRRFQLDATIRNLQWQLLKGASGKPEHCANCYFDGNGRSDYYDCEGCIGRLSTNPPLPAPCRTHRCSERPAKCIHTMPSSLCPECIDEGDEADAKRDDSSWCCGLCATFYNVWGDKPTTERGVFLDTTVLESAIAVRFPMGVPAAIGAFPGGVELSSEEGNDEEAGPSNPRQNRANRQRRQRQRQQRGRRVSRQQEKELLVNAEQEADEEVDEEEEIAATNRKKPRKGTHPVKNVAVQIVPGNARAGPSNERGVQQRQQVHQPAPQQAQAQQSAPQQRQQQQQRQPAPQQVQQRQQQQPTADQVMQDAVLRALYTHPDLDQDLVRRYMPTFLKYGPAMLSSVGQVILNFAAEPSVRSLQQFIEGILARQQ